MMSGAEAAHVVAYEGSILGKALESSIYGTTSVDSCFFGVKSSRKPA